METRSRRILDTKSDIVTAAKLIVLNEGVDKLNTNHIAKRAGVSIGTLYNHFKDKDGIIAEIIEQVIEKRISRIREAMNFSLLLSSDEEIVWKIVDSFFHEEIFEDATLQASLLPFVPEQGRQRLARLNRIEGHIKPVIRALFVVKAPHLLARDVEIIAFVLIQSITAVILSAHLPEGQDLNREKLKGELVKLILGYLRKD